MSRSEVSGPAISLEQFMVLNDEIAALVRAGVPLEQGLFEVAGDLPGRLAELALQLGKRIQSGEPLEQILARDQSPFPPVWRAVVAAGLRSGNLVVALEDISATAHRIADARRGIRAAMIYPTIVITFAFASFVLLVTHVAPTAAAVLRDLTSSSDPILSTLVWLGETAKWWGIGIPLVVLLLVVAWWRRSRRSFFSGGRIYRRGRLPSLSGSALEGRMATFAEILSLLLKREVPLAEAIVLAGDASGDGNLRQAAVGIAHRLQRGEVVTPKDARVLGLPSLLGWLLSAEKQPIGLAGVLSQFAEQCRQRADRQAAITITYWPIVATVLLGGMVTLIQGVALFWPISRMLSSLGRPF